MTRRCRHCKEPYEPRNSLQKVCGPKCAIELVRVEYSKAQERQQRQETREARKRIKTRSEWAEDAQRAFNAWVRERDYGMPCISCGTTANVQYCAGHFRTVGACPELRFEPLNVHLQCNRNCNMAKSGNQLEYRIRLAKKIGADKVAWLEGPHDPKKYTIDQLKEIKTTYAAKARQLKREREQCAA